MKKKKPANSISVKGMFRIHIEENGKLVGDSGWRQNQITNLGFNSFIVNTLGGITGSSRVGAVALASGSTIASNATALTGELAKRTTVTATSVGSQTLRYTASFVSQASSSANFNTVINQTIQAIGLYVSSSGGSTLFAGNTFSSSTLSTNQSVNVTYDIIFA